MSDERSAGAGTDAISKAAAEGCAESRLLMSRRGVLGLSVGLYSWAFMPKFAEAASSGNDPRLLIVILRGGMDGINTVVPHGDKAYVSMRGSIALPRSATIRLDNFFGLHPALDNFGKMYRKKEAAIVHATCVPLHNRSHFDGQDNLENGQPGLASNSTGWLNRLLTGLPKGDPILAHGAIQVGEAPLILHGPAPVLGWSPSSFANMDRTTEYLIRTLYREHDKDMYQFLERGLKADALAEKVGKDDGNVSSLRRGFRGAARLLAAKTGPRIAVLSVGGWDTHSDQGGATGSFANVLSELDLGLDDFKAEAGKAWDQSVVVCATEFGRTVRVNGSDGTDHGVGTVAMLAGGAVRGGKVYGDWPGLAAPKLYDGSDLRPTTDLRSVFKGILKEHMDVPNTILDETVFPESKSVKAMKNLVRSGGKKKKKSASDAMEMFGTAPQRPEQPIARYRRGDKVSGEFSATLMENLPPVPLRPN